MHSLLSYLDLILAGVLQDYLRAHDNDDVQKLLLKQHEIHGVPTKYVAQLIAGRQKIKQKLPSWWARTDLLYPPSVNLEQASSEATAKFKRDMIVSIIPKHERAADLTGGFGVDAFFLSATVRKFAYVEKDPTLLEIARENFKALHSTNIETYINTAENFIASTTEKFDFIYMDPSRRKAAQKVFKLADCEPDITKLQKSLFLKTDVIIVKASPLLDIQKGVSELDGVAEVHVVAVDNECKELLFVMRQEFQDEPVIKAVDLSNQGSVIREIAFKRSDELNATVQYSSPMKFIYEPGAAVLKAGAFKAISKLYGIAKLAPNTHLYTSDERLDFPGRTFRVVRATKLDKQLKNEFAGGHANILTRNYPLSVEEIKKRAGLKEGGEQYLICTQDQKEKLVLIAERINA